MGLSERNVFSLFAVLFVLVGIPFFLGVLGVYNGITKQKHFYSGKPKYIVFKEECGDKIVHNNCLEVIIEKDTLLALLSVKEADRFFNTKRKSSEIEMEYSDKNIRKLIINDSKILSRINSLYSGVISILLIRRSLLKYNRKPLLSISLRFSVFSPKLVLRKTQI